jgi:hypothetical protein
MLFSDSMQMNVMAHTWEVAVLDSFSMPRSCGLSYSRYRLQKVVACSILADLSKHILLQYTSKSRHNTMHCASSLVSTQSRLGIYHIWQIVTIMAVRKIGASYITHVQKTALSKSKGSMHMHALHILPLARLATPARLETDRL